MKAYRMKDVSGIEELGEQKLEAVLELIRSAKKSEGAEEFGVGFYRSEKDFLEVRYVGKNQYMIWSDRIAGAFWKRLLSKSNIDRVVDGEQRAFEAVKFYFERSREEFERKYGQSEWA